MVIKLLLGLLLVLPGFESSVISYGNQTCERHRESRFQFESSVISYGNLVFEDKNHLNREYPKVCVNLQTDVR